MRIKRIGRWAIALGLLLAAITMVSAAAGTSVIVQAPEKLPEVGGRFTVTVSVQGNPGIGAVQVKLGYDDSVITCTDVKTGTIAEGMMAANNPHSTRDGVGAVFAAASSSPVTRDGTVAVFTFEVTAAGDAKLSIGQTTLADGEGTELPFTYSLPALIAQESTSESSGAQGSGTEETAGRFRDVPRSHWAFDAVERAAQLGLVDGFSDGSFRPNAPVTRAQFVLMLWRMAGKPEAAQHAAFADTASGGWYRQALDWAVERGVVEGVSQTQFAPDAAITRQQAMAILFRYAGGTSGAETMLADIYESTFTDSGSIAGWARDAVWWAVYDGLVSGVGNNQIAPGANASRAQTAAILLRYRDQFLTETEGAA